MTTNQMHALLIDLEDIDTEIDSLTDYEYVRGYEFGDVVDTDDDSYDEDYDNDDE